MGFPGGAGGKESAGDIRDMDVTPVSGRSLEEGTVNPLQCFCLENPIVRGAG